MGFLFFTAAIIVLYIIARVSIVAMNKAPGITNETKLPAWPATVIALVLFLLVLGLCSITTVSTGKIAVMTRFGNVTGQELRAGLHFKMPIDKANVYDVRVQKEEVEASAASKDLQDVTATLVLNYDLTANSVDDVHKTLGSGYKDKVIAPALQEVFKASTSQFETSNLITDRPAVKAAATRALKKRLEPFGINIVELNITNFSFSKSFSDAIEAKQVAQQDAERAQFNLQASKTDAEAQKAQSLTLSPIYLQKLFLDKWNGQLPQVLGGDSNLLLNLLNGQ